MGQTYTNLNQLPPFSATYDTPWSCYDNTASFNLVTPSYANQNASYAYAPLPQPMGDLGMLAGGSDAESKDFPDLHCLPFSLDDSLGLTETRKPVVTLDSLLH